MFLILFAVPKASTQVVKAEESSSCDNLYELMDFSPPYPGVSHTILNTKRYLKYFDNHKIYIEIVNMNLFKGLFVVKRAALRAAKGYGFEVSAELEPIKIAGMLNKLEIIVVFFIIMVLIL